MFNEEVFKFDIDNIKNTKILPYIYNMQEVMEVSNLVVARSGAMTVTEIANLEKPAIFIPFPFATENHQEYNAKVLEKVGVYGTLREVKEAIIKEMIKDEVNHRKTEPLYKLIPLMRQMYNRFYEENMECCFVG